MIFYDGIADCCTIKNNSQNIATLKLTNKFRYQIHTMIHTIRFKFVALLALPDAVIVPEAILCYHLLAGRSVWVTLTDALGEGPTDGEVKLTAGDMMPLVAIGNETIIRVLQCERNTPIISPVL